MKERLLQDLEKRFKSVSQLRNLAQSYDEGLFHYLLEESEYKEELKNRFFVSCGETLIFKSDDFLSFLNLRKLSGSFTSYANKIGLSSKTKAFLKSQSEVVLNFAFKDGVIKGGQSKDEQKSQEIFFNEILARDEIDVLFAKKALQNFEFLGQEKSLKDANFLIKGNNLLALHSLKKRYASKVKLIYIDPPYNTGNDSFNYNDKFNHSTWLSFMKNRLEVAREFLREDGVIFIQCDDNEQAYLKVLCDEIFGRENFVGCLVWANKEGGGKSDSKHFRKKHEYILCYAKYKEILEIHGQNVEDIERYTLSDKHEKTRGKYQLVKLDSGSLGWIKSLDYPIELEGKTFYAGGDYEKWLDRQKGGASIKDWGWRWRWSKDKLEWGLKNDFIEIKQNSKGEWNIYTKQYLNCDNEGNIKPRTLKPMALIEKHSNTQSNKHMKTLEFSFSYSKPEALIMDIIKAATNENDLIMDFFAGSGTTLAVAHKMKRRWIGIEQMDYIQSITKERLKKVIEGEQGGVSKALQWQGGGGFVYAEFMPLNALFKEKIAHAKEKELEGIYEELKTKAFLDYRVDIENMLKDKEFKDLDLENKKEILKLILDTNMDYVLYEDIEDKSYGIDKATVKLNQIFYGDKNE